MLIIISPSVDSHGAPYCPAASGLCIVDHNQLCITDSGNPALQSFLKKIYYLKVEWTSISVLSGPVSRELITDMSSAGVCISTPLQFAAQIDTTSQAQSSTGSFTNASLGL